MVELFKLELSVVGMSHWTPIEYRERLRDRLPVPCELVRDPDNEHDPNAIKVMVENRQIGFIPRHVAKLLAARMDKGAIQITKATLTELDQALWEGTVTIKFKKLSKKT